MSCYANKLTKFIDRILNISPHKLIYFILSVVTDLATYLLIAAIVLIEIINNYLTNVGYNLPYAIIAAHQIYLYMIFLFGLFYHFTRFAFDKRFVQRKLHAIEGKLFTESNAYDMSTVDMSPNGVGIRCIEPLQVGELYKLSTSEGVISGVIVWYNSRKKRGGFQKLNSKNNFMTSVFR